MNSPVLKRSKSIGSGCDRNVIDGEALRVVGENAGRALLSEAKSGSISKTSLFSSQRETRTVFSAVM